MNNLPKKLHITGICGVAMSAIAIAFKKRGVIVTGSDKGFFPPVSTELEKQGITFYAGWHPEKMIEGGMPDTIMIGAASGSQNPETVFAKEHNVPTYSYPEILGKYFIRQNSIVCSGTWGKTSSSAMLSFIMEYAGMDPSYMFGGVSLSHDSSAKLSDSMWNVFEGDEYKSSPTDQSAKFFHYKPTHLMLSAISWDHADLYPTEESYYNTFEKLLQGMSKNGLLVARAHQAGIEKVIGAFKGKVIAYGAIQNETEKSRAAPNYSYSDVRQSPAGIDFKIFATDNSGSAETFNIHSPMLGAYQAENITGCFAMAMTIGIKPEKTIEAISKFQGLRRRMEKRLDGAKTQRRITVIDDIAHSPEKAVSVLATLKEIYGKNDGKIIVVFEPNQGGRERSSASKYDDAFKDADMVIIPKLTKLKIAQNSGDSQSETPMEGDELAKKISTTHSNTVYIEVDQKLVNYLGSFAKSGDVIAFLGSHGFRGMIEECVKRTV